MKRFLWMVVALALLMGGVAQADPFVYPPETNWTPTWQTPFPYQRNIYWDFNSVSPVGGPSPNGTPGAVYEGYDDPVLKSTDWVSFSGSAQWYSSWTDYNGTFTGGIGIFNTTGEVLTGTATFEIDDLTGGELKLLYQEMVTDNSPGAVVGLSFVLPGGYTYSNPYFASQTVNSELLDDLGWEITPNPPWEELVVSFQADPGAWAMVDSLHVATYCPEPTTLVSLGTGALCLCLYAWRRRQRTV
jgi:hypothetical protein